MRTFVLLSTLLCAAATAAAAQWIENERGIVGYDDTPKLPWVEFRKHDSSRPVPPHVEARAVVVAPPADAVVLFGGDSLAAFQPGTWRVENGGLIAGKGDLVSLAAFGDCQIHLEFRVPAEPASSLGDRGNSGIFPMGFYEIQIFDSHPSHRVQIYADGQCAAIYGETPPRVNASRPPGEWQSYDLIFIAPRFDGDRLVSPARVTLLHNGVLVHLDEEVRGRTGHRSLGAYAPHADRLPLKLQGHGSAVAFRNIWVRPLTPPATGR
jgi:hypothetical protein